jgi:hypothetical protein
MTGIPLTAEPPTMSSARGLEPDLRMRNNHVLTALIQFTRLPTFTWRPVPGPRRLARSPKGPRPAIDDLFGASMEEIGARTTVYGLRGFRNDKKKHLYRLLEQVTAPTTKPDTSPADAAATLLCERLTTPLQFELYLTRAFEKAFGVSQKPVDVVVLG